MKKKIYGLGISVSLSLVLLIPSLLLAGNNVAKPSKAEVVRKTQNLHVPFIANEGQVDEQVRYYAKTFSGTVYVTRDGGIMYALPKYEETAKEDRNGWMARELRGRGAGVSGGVLSCLYNVENMSILDIINSLLSEPLQCRGAVPAPSPAPSPSSPLPAQHENRQTKSQLVVLKESLIGAKISEIQGEGESATRVSYFKGSDPSKWKSGIATYNYANLGEVYDGITLKLKAHGNNVEKLFTVKPGANPDQIKISLSGLQPTASALDKETQPPESPFVKGDLTKSPLEKGARGLYVNEQGELVAETGLGPVTFTSPVAYQEIDGKRVEVGVEYNIHNVKIEETGGWGAEAQGNKGEPETRNSKLETYSFTVVSYDKAHDLIIDPLLASTFLGGSGNDYGGYGIVVDGSNNVFVTGYTADAATDLPTTTGAYDEVHNGNEDVFISKFNNTLTTLSASTFLGGTSNDRCYAIKVDSSDNVYVTGASSSSDFPTTGGAYDTGHNGTFDVFVSKFNNTLTTLSASTFLGGSANDAGFGIALDGSNNVFVTGYTADAVTDLPTTSGAYDETHNGSDDVFVAKFNNTLTTLSASTLLGGSAADYGRGIVVDSSNNVFVTGETADAVTDLPTTTGAYDEVHNGAIDAFVSKFNNTLTTLSASTFLGGTSDDRCYAIKADSSDNIFATGASASSDFPTTGGAYDTSHNGGGDVIVVKLNNTLTTLQASTFLGGSGSDVSFGFIIDASGNVLVTGGTADAVTDLPTTTGAYDEVHNGNKDVFVSKFNNTLTTLSESTFLGGSGDDEGYGLALDASNKIFVTGYTNDTATDLPTTTGAYDEVNNGLIDVFVAKFGTTTYVDLVSFIGKVNNDGTITLTWETAAEIDNAGFNVYRARRKNGEYQRLNNALIPAKGSPMEGAVYEYTDTPGRPDVYYYQLEDIDRSGASTMHGPVRVVARMGRRR